MYDMHKRAPVRTSESGFVIPSQNEWIKAAYYDRNGGGTYSYWQYPTNDGARHEARPPHPGDAQPGQRRRHQRRRPQPLANFHAEGQEAPSWCPSNQTQEACETVNPLHLPPNAYKKAFQGSLNTVGQAGTYGPWGTLEQGGNAVEWTDTITPPPFGAQGPPGLAAPPRRRPQRAASTSSGSRRSACSRRTTTSSSRPTRGSGSGSA